MSSIDIEHNLSSMYHLESQGALERWHQTLKTMLQKYFIGTGRSWDDGNPFVLFAAQEAVQDLLGLSAAELVFGHTCPLIALKEKFPKNILDYVSQFRDVYTVCTFAKEALASSQ